MSGNTTSFSLIQRLRLPGEEASWERFVQLYTPLLFFWAERRAGLSRAEAEDLVQDLLIHLMDRLPEFEYDSGRSFRGWLRTVLLNRSRDYWRKKGRQPAAMQSGELRNLDTSDDVEMFTEDEYRTHLAQRALELMKDEFQESTWKACWLHVVEGKPAKEISQLLEISENAVYLAKARVLKRLREELTGLWDD